MIPQLIPANEADIPKIIALAERIWQEHYPPMIGQAQVDYMLNLVYSAESLKTQMQDGQAFYLIGNASQPLGFVAISRRQSGDCFIHKFYIDNQEHRKGMGSLVFEQLIQLYQDVEEMRLQVNRFNFKAINFYFKLGFVIELVADFDIGNGYFMNDFVMVWKRK